MTELTPRINVRFLPIVETAARSRPEPGHHGKNASGNVQFRPCSIRDDRRKRCEFPQFPAALSFIMVLFPEEARDLLSQRASAVERHVKALKQVLSGDSGPRPPRVALLETEYLLAMAQAEAAWLRRIAEELRSGALTWSQAELAEAARTFL